MAEAANSAYRVTTTARAQLVRKQCSSLMLRPISDGSVAILLLDHQEVMNAVRIDMLAGLARALDAIDDKRAATPFCHYGCRRHQIRANLQGPEQQSEAGPNAGAALKPLTRSRRSRGTFTFRSHLGQLAARRR